MNDRILIRGQPFGSHGGGVGQWNSNKKNLPGKSARKMNYGNKKVTSKLTQI